MDNLDGNALLDGERFRHWTCGQGHVLGVIERVRMSLQVDDMRVRYFTSRLVLFRNAVDMAAERPAEIEVSTSLDGRFLSMMHTCTVCGMMREWHPQKKAAELLASMYLAE